MQTFNKFNTDIVVVCCVCALTTVRSDIENNYECRQVTANMLCLSLRPAFRLATYLIKQNKMLY